MTLPSRYYRDPLDVLMEKEAAVDRRVGGCKGCDRLTVDTSSDRIITVCSRGRKVGGKGKCSLFKEEE